MFLKLKIQLFSLLSILVGLRHFVSPLLKIYKARPKTPTTTTIQWSKLFSLPGGLNQVYGLPQ